MHDATMRLGFVSATMTGAGHAPMRPASARDYVTTLMVSSARDNLIPVRCCCCGGKRVEERAVGGGAFYV